MKRYRLRPRRFTFALKDGKLIETQTGVLCRNPRCSVIIGQEPPPESERSPRNIYLTAGGKPADRLSEYILRRDMTDDLCVLLCRLCPEPTLTADSSDEEVLHEAEHYEELLYEAGLSTELMPHTFAQPSIVPPQAGHFAGMSPSAWCRAVENRLGLFFRRHPRHPAIRRMARYFTQGRWTYWREDPRLSALRQEYERDDRLQRLLQRLEGIAWWRLQIAYGKQGMKEPFRLRLRHPHGRYVFAFPPGRRGKPARVQKEVRELLWHILPFLIQGPWFEDRWLAAAVWVGQEYLEKPARLSGRRLTQDFVAAHFGLTRRQLTRALSRVRQPQFTKPFWDAVEERARRRTKQS